MQTFSLSNTNTEAIVLSIVFFSVISLIIYVTLVRRISSRMVKGVAYGALVLVFFQLSFIIFLPLVASIDVTSDKIKVDALLYSNSLNRSEIDVDGMYVDRRLHPHQELGLRTNGIGIGSFHVGWFELKDSSKSFVVMTSDDSVLYIPTKRGYSFIISPKQPSIVLEHLK